MSAPARAWHLDFVRFAREIFDARGFDQRIDGEGAAGLVLTIQAMAAMRKHRPRCEPIAHRAARAAAFKRLSHRLASLLKSRCNALKRITLPLQQFAHFLLMNR
jgi:hypothetical protein